MQAFNGDSFWQEELRLGDELQITSGSVSFEVYFHRHWWAEVWPLEWSDSDIVGDLTFHRFFPLFVAVRIRVDDLRNRTVHFWSDNQAVVQVVKSLTSKSPWVMALVMIFTPLCLRLNVLFLACHVPTASNRVADVLSQR